MIGSGRFSRLSANKFDVLARTTIFDGHPSPLRGGREGGSRSWYKAVLLRRFYEYAFSGANCAPPPLPPSSCAPEGGAVDAGNRGWKARTLYRWTIIHRPRFVVETRETFPLVPGSFGTLSRQSPHRSMGICGELVAIACFLDFVYLQAFFLNEKTNG